MLKRVLIFASALVALASSTSPVSVVKGSAVADRYLKNLQENSNALTGTKVPKKIAGKGKKQYKKMRQRFADGSVKKSMKSGEVEILRREHDFEALKSDLENRAKLSEIEGITDSDSGKSINSEDASDEYDDDDEEDDEEGDVMEEVKLIDAVVDPVVIISGDIKSVQDITTTTTTTTVSVPAIEHIIAKPLEEEKVQPLAAATSVEKSVLNTLVEHVIWLTKVLTSRLPYDGDIDYNNVEEVEAVVA